MRILALLLTSLAIAFAFPWFIKLKGNDEPLFTVDCNNMDLNPLNYPYGGLPPSGWLEWNPLRINNYVTKMRLRNLEQLFPGILYRDLESQALQADMITKRYATCNNFVDNQIIGLKKIQDTKLNQINTGGVGNVAYLALHASKEYDNFFTNYLFVMKDEHEKLVAKEKSKQWHKLDDRLKMHMDVSAGVVEYRYPIDAVENEGPQWPVFEF